MGERQNHSRSGKRDLRDVIGKSMDYKELWWWNEEVQIKIKDKNNKFKAYGIHRGGE